MLRLLLGPRGRAGEPKWAWANQGSLACVQAENSFPWKKSPGWGLPESTHRPLRSGGEGTEALMPDSPGFQASPSPTASLPVSHPEVPLVSLKLALWAEWGRGLPKSSWAMIQPESPNQMLGPPQLCQGLQRWGWGCGEEGRRPVWAAGCAHMCSGQGLS